MRWSLFLLLLMIAIPDVHAAVIYGGKLFHGEKFTSNIGGNYTIFGSDQYTYTDNTTDIKERRYRKAVIRSDVDETVYVLNGSCYSTNIYKYCYIDSYVDFDNVQTFKNGYVESQMSVSIESLPPPSTLIEITRNQSITAYCGEVVKIPILVKNSGESPTNITYSEELPVNTFISDSAGGTVDGNKVTFKERLQPNKTGNYSYTLINFDCTPKAWHAVYSFTTFNDTLWKNISDLDMGILASYTVMQNITPNKTNAPTVSIVYSLNMTNIHPSLTLYADFSIYAPGLRAVDSSNGVYFDGKNYKYTGYAYVNDSLDVFITFNSNGYYDYTIDTNGSIKISDRRSYYSYQQNGSVIYPQMMIYFDVKEIGDETITADIVIKNTDLSEKNYYIYGIVRGINAEEPIYLNSIEPDTILVVDSRIYNVSRLDGSANLSFTGVYRDKNSVEHALYAEKLFSISPDRKITEEKSAVPVAPSQPVNGGIVPEIDTTTNSQTQTDSGSQNPSSGSQTTASTDDEPKKDFVTRTLEALSKFLDSLFS